MPNIEISIARDFSTSPAGRYPSDGPYNGTRFREQILIPAIKKAASDGEKVIVDFNDVDSLSSSFLEEAFGGLSRSKLVAPHIARSTLVLVPGDHVYDAYVRDAFEYLNESASRSFA